MTLAILIANFLKYWKYIALAILLGISFSAGMKHSQKKFERVESKRLQAEVKFLKEEMDEARIENQRLMLIANESIVDLVNKLSEEEKNKKVITKEITKYVKVNADCNLAVGAVGLLNNARSGVITDGNMSDPSGTTDAEKRLATSFEQTDEIKAHLFCISEYNKLSSRNNALIDWFKESSKKTENEK